MRQAFGARVIGLVFVTYIGACTAGDVVTTGTTGTTGSNRAGTTGTDKVDMAGMDTAQPTQVPQGPLPIVPNQGGPTVGAVKLVTMSYAGSQFEDVVKSFGDYVVSSSWLEEVGAEYGVQNGTHQHVTLHDVAPSTIDAQGIGAFIAAQIKAGKLPAPDVDTIYMYYAAPQTTMSDGDPSYSCSASAGRYTPAYHSEAQVGTQHFAFGVVPTCSLLSTAILEMSTAHELIEAATDPLLGSAPAYIFSKTDAWWQTGGEVSDICDAQITRDGHTLTRAWSNAAASAGTNPCVPTDTSYTTVKVPSSIVLPVGGTMTFAITGWALQAAPAWWVYALPGVYGSQSLAPDIDVAQLTDGEVAHVQVTAPDGGKSGDVVQMLIYSESTDDKSRFVVPVTVTLQ